MANDERFQGRVEATLDSIETTLTQLREDSKDSRVHFTARLDDIGSGLRGDHRELSARVDEHMKHDDKRFATLWKASVAAFSFLASAVGLSKYFGGQ